MSYNLIIYMFNCSCFLAVFCEDLYKSLQCSENGRIIWTFLKPLLQGRITYTPDNYITRSIMKEVKTLHSILCFLFLFCNSSVFMFSLLNFCAAPGITCHQSVNVIYLFEIVSIILALYSLLCVYILGHANIQRYWRDKEFCQDICGLIRLLATVR